MAKPVRSPLLGYNHNVKYGGHVFHIQTEDSGPANPHVFTHLFFEGSILGSKRCQYEASAPDDEVRGLMQAQHKSILRELKQKAFDERIVRFFASRGEVFQSEEATPAESTRPAARDNGAELATPPPEAPPVELPITPGPKAAVLDLDAIPAPAPERGPTPEPLPIHLSKPPLPGPGTYTFRRPTRGLGEPAATPTPAPVLTPTPIPTPTPGNPIVPVVVQRQVVVGAGAPPAMNTRATPATPVRRRPAGVPYVVKEGSHAAIPATVASPGAPSPLAAVSDASRAPRTAETPRPAQEAAPSALLADQSLDDVILAYLSQGDGKH